MRINFKTEEVQLLVLLIESDISAHKNWIATAVENGEVQRAQDLVTVLRKLQDLRARFKNTLERGA